MHIEIQVALNFVISYLYNKLPRRRVNIFGEELEKALKDKFQGHWYPEKPFKGSAFRCLKTGDPIDPVLERAARESGVPIADILENLPNELSVWIDPGEVSFRIGEKGQVKILYSESSDNHEENTSADREVNKTFNPEAQCFRPIDAVNAGINNMSLSPKTSPHSGSSPHSACSSSPTYKGSPNPAAQTASNSAFMHRAQAPLTFTTATFAQTKFGSTKLKTSSKRTNSSSYRMSPTEFSNYIKQRAMQQQLHHGHGPATAAQPPNHFGPIGPVSPARSISPNPLSLGLGPDPFYFPSMAMGMYPQFNGHRNIFDTPFHSDVNGLYSNGGAGSQSKFSAYLDPHGYYGLGNHMQQQQHQQQQQPSQQQQVGPIGNPQQHQNGNIKSSGDITNKDNTDNSNNVPNSANATLTVTVAGSNAQNPSSPVPMSVSPAAGSNAAAAAAAVVASNQDSTNSKLIDGLNSFYSNAATTGSYQQLLVA